MSISDKLKNYDELFKTFPLLDGDVPDGDYSVIVDNVSLEETNNGSIILKWALLVTYPLEFRGCIIYTNNFIGSDKSIGFLKRNLQKCGLFLENLSDLPTKLEILLDKKLNVSKKTNGKYINLFFRTEEIKRDSHLNIEIEQDGIFKKSDSNNGNDDIPF